MEKIQPTERSGENRRITAKARPGETIESLAERLPSLWEPNSYVYVKFDGVELAVGGGDTPEDIVRKYNEIKANPELSEFK